METIKEEKKADLEKRVELLEKVVKALCKGKKDNIHDMQIGDLKGLINEFEYQMEKIDFNYKD